jgi:hypothetical protein
MADEAPLPRRLLWLAAIWAASVFAVVAIAAILRACLKP